VLAEREGFEPPEPCGSTVFKTAAFDRSATSPMEVGDCPHPATDIQAPRGVKARRDRQPRHGQCRERELSHTLRVELRQRTEV